MTSVSRRYGVHQPFYDLLKREADAHELGGRAMTAETDGPLDEHGKLRPCSPVLVPIGSGDSKLSLEERLALVEDDLTDLSRLFVRLEAVVLRGDRNGYPRPPKPNVTPTGDEKVHRIPNDRNITCACSARFCAPVYREVPSAFRGVHFAGFEWRCTACPSPACTTANRRPVDAPTAGVEAHRIKDTMPATDGQHATASGVNSTPIPKANAVETVEAQEYLAGMPAAFDTLRRALQADPDYAWSWHCNIAMAFYDVGGDHAMANKAAHLFMQRTFGVVTVEPGKKT